VEEEYCRILSFKGAVRGKIRELMAHAPDKKIQGKTTLQRIEGKPMVPAFLGKKSRKGEIELLRMFPRRRRTKPNRLHEQTKRASERIGEREERRGGEDLHENGYFSENEREGTTFVALVKPLQQNREGEPADCDERVLATELLKRP